MIVLFWISALIVGYVYLGYPGLLALWARIADRRPRREPFADGAWPSISIVIAAGLITGAFFLSSPTGAPSAPCSPPG